MAGPRTESLRPLSARRCRAPSTRDTPVLIPWPQPQLGSQEPERTCPLTQTKRKHVPSSSSKPGNSWGEGQLSKRSPDAQECNFQTE